MLMREALLHIPKSNYAYGYDKDTLHIRVRTKKNDVKKASIKIGDPYIWEKGGADGGNLSATDAYGWTGSMVIEMEKEASTEYYDYWFISYKPDKKRARYAFILEDDDEQLLYGERRIVKLTKENGYVLNDMANFFCFPYLNECDVHIIPSWVKDTVWYQIFPDRFHDGDHSLDPDSVEPWGAKPTYYNFMGGDLQGITDKLDYLNDLGVNGIYLCPIFDATTNHRYDTVDYMTIDPMLGDKKTFKKLVEEAHKRGIKIMLDAVFNHMGYMSKQWQDVVEHNEKSKYKDWFHIHRFPVYDVPYDQLDAQNLNYETFGRVKTMPKVNTDNPEVIKYFMEVSKYWVSEFDVDAWRIDVANEVDHKFWREFRKAVKAVKPDAFLLGEIWHDAGPWLLGDQFDVAMNYPLTEAMIHYFCSEDIDKQMFVEAVNKVKVSYSMQVTENNFNLLDSHDTSRIFSIAGKKQKRLRLAYLFMLTQPGSPCLYYGSEIPMPGVKKYMDESHRSCMSFEHTEKPFYKFMQKLIKIRHENHSIKEAETTWVTSGDEHVLIYKKGPVVVIMNNQKEKTTLVLPSLLKHKKIFNLFSEVDDVLSETLNLKGYDYLVLRLNN